MKKVFSIILMSFFMTLSLYSFNKQNQVITGLQQGDYETVNKLLLEWERESPDDPDLMTGWFNYYLHRKAEYRSFDGYMKNGQYGLYPKLVYDKDDFKTAISYLDKALQKNPYRMDIHFGKINTLLSDDDYSEGIEAIIEFLKVYDENKTEWYWSYNQNFISNNWDVEEAVIDALTDYCGMFDYYIERNSIKNVLDEILIRFPNNVIFLNYLAHYYSAGKDYDKTIETLLSAYQIDNTDYIVVANIAATYEKKEDYIEAEKWYKTLASMEPDEAKQYAQQGLERIINR